MSNETKKNHNDNQNVDACHCGHSLNDVTLGISFFANTALA